MKVTCCLFNSACTLNDGPIPVSSEGLGCSDISSPVSVEEPVRQPLIPSLVNSTTGKSVGCFRIQTLLACMLSSLLMHSFKCTVVLMLLFNMLLNMYSKGQPGLGSRCVLPEICPPFFGPSHTSGRGHPIPMAFKEKNGAGQRLASASEPLWCSVSCL